MVTDHVNYEEDHNQQLKTGSLGQSQMRAGLFLFAREYVAIVSIFEEIILTVRVRWDC